MEAEVLEQVERRRHNHLRVTISEIVHDFAELLLADLVLDVRVIHRQGFVEQCATKRGLEKQRIAKRPAFLQRHTARRHHVREADLDLRLQIE